jgi:glycosyltransferase involved in cell wall biosynthesis
MKRLAYCSPVNPAPSGISDYSEELLPYLGRYAEIVLFVPGGQNPANLQLKRHLDVRPIADLPRLNARRPFDGIVYHMGNSPVHAEIYEQMQRLPGVVVLHEWVLHHFKLWYAAARLHDPSHYRQEMEQRYGDRGGAIAQRMARGHLLEAAFEMPLVEDIVERAAALIGHSRYVVARVSALRPDLPVAVVPMGVPLAPPIDRELARRRLGLPADAAIWASFGHVNPYKRTEPALRAFRRFLRWEPDARYILVGSVSPAYDLRAVIKRLGLDATVEITGYVEAEAFASYVAASDLCLNLRYPTAGETSASLLRLLGAGRPTLVSATGALDELPDNVCCKVDLGTGERDQILAYARFLRKVPSVAAQLGRNARHYVARAHSLEGAARGYLEFLGRLYGWGPPAALRPPLWTAVAPDISESVHMLPAATTVVVSSAAGDHQQSMRQPDSIRQLASDTAHALGELDVEPQAASIADVAMAIADLFEPGPRPPGRQR